MRPNDDIDFTTLTWVKGELDETLKQAQQALEAYVEEPNDASQMRFCATYLHQVQGTLRMVELYGAAMVTEEMEQLASALLDGDVKDRDEAYAVLMRGIVQLPDYLERLQSGHKDIPIVLLPLLNDLRAARGEKGLSEIALFTPDLGRALPASASGPATALPDAELRRAAGLLRGHFQLALLKWFKGENADANVGTLTQVCDKLVTLTSQEEARRLFWVAASVLDALRAKAFEPSPQLKQTIGKVEREIKRLADAGENSFRVDPPRELTRNLLYFVAHAPTEHGRIGELREVFNLASLLPSSEEIEHARGSMSGHNRALLDTVSAAIKDDLMRVKDALDLYLRTQNAQPASLSSQVDVLDRVSDTLGMLGLGVARRVVVEQRDAVHQVASGHRPADESTLLDIAGALLYVEATLDDQVQHLGSAAASGSMPTDGRAPMQLAETRRVLEAVVKEAQTNFAAAKQAFVAFIESSWDHTQLDAVPSLMSEVAGAMRIVELPRPAQYLDAIKQFTQVELLSRRRVPAGTQMETLADVLASLEYFLEALGEHRAGRDRILDVAERSLEALGYWPVPIQAVAPTAAEQAEVDARIAESIASDDGITGVAPSDAYSVEEPLLIAETPLPPWRGDSPIAKPVEPIAASAAPVVAPPVAAPVVAEPVVAEPVAAAVAVPAGVPLSGFEGASDEIDDEIRDVFIEEVQEEIANLEELLPAWKADPHSLDTLKSIRRVFHTLKGSGRLVGALTLGEFSWKIESMLNRVLDHTIQPTPAVIELVDHAFDALPELLAALRGQGTTRTDLEAIKAVADRVAAGEQARYEPRPVALAPVAAVALPPVVAETVLPDIVAEPEPVAVAADTAVDADIAAIEFDVADIDVPNAAADTRDGADPDAIDLDAIDLDTIEFDTAEAVSDAVVADTAAAPADEAAASIEFVSELPLADDVEDSIVFDDVAAASAQPAAEPTPSIAVPSIDPVLFDILKAEVAGHLETVDSYLAASTHVPQPIPDVLLRAVHTMNGAFAMTDVPVVTDVLGPLEGYFKRLLAHGLAPNANGRAALVDAATAVRALMLELERPLPRLVDLSSLAERIAIERDALPEPGQHVEAAMPSDVFEPLTEADHAELTEAVSMSQLRDDTVDEAFDVDALEAQLDALAHDDGAVEPAASSQDASVSTDRDEAPAPDASATWALADDTPSEAVERIVVGEDPIATSLPETHTIEPFVFPGDYELTDTALTTDTIDASAIDAAGFDAALSDATLSITDVAETSVQVSRGDDVPAIADDVLLSDAGQGFIDPVAIAEPSSSEAAGTLEPIAFDDGDARPVDVLVTEADRLAWADAARLEQDLAAAVAPADDMPSLDRDGDDRDALEAELIGLDIDTDADATNQFELVETEFEGELPAAPSTLDEPVSVDALYAGLDAEPAADRAPQARDDEAELLALIEAYDAPATQPSDADTGIAAFDDGAETIDTIDATGIDVSAATPVDDEIEAFLAASDIPGADVVEWDRATRGDDVLASTASNDASSQDADTVAASIDTVSDPEAVVTAGDATSDTLAPIADATPDAFASIVDNVPDAFESDARQPAAADVFEFDTREPTAADTVAFDEFIELAGDGSEAAAKPLVASDDVDAFWRELGVPDASTAADVGAASDAVAAEPAQSAAADTIDLLAEPADLDAFDWDELERLTRTEPSTDLVDDTAGIAGLDAAHTSDADAAADADVVLEAIADEPAPAVDDTPAVVDADSTATVFDAAPAVADARDEDDAPLLFQDDADEDLPAAPPAAVVVQPVAPATPQPDARDLAIAAAFLAGLDDADPDPDAALELADMDEELLDIFLEEGGDLLDHSDALMAKLRDVPDDRETVVGLQRDLHTLKGGARMAGLVPVGDLGHSMESLLEAVAEGRRELPRHGVELLQRAFDRLHGMVTRVGERRALAMPTLLIERVEMLGRGQVPEIALPDDAAAVNTLVVSETPQVDIEPAVAGALPKRPAPLSEPIAETFGDDDDIAARLPQEQIRIRADLLDRLVNYAGEVAIYRARLEQQLGLFRSNLGELDQTTLRLREQLRKLEIETEAQIASRYQREAEVGNDPSFDPLELDRFSTLQQLSRALSESAADIVNLQGALDDHTRQYETLLLQQSRVSSDLQEGLMRTRMVPFDSLVPRLRRIIRQTGTELGKKAQLKVDGAQGEMDRNVLERMTAPLEHMLRNALAHGLEVPADRIAAGKPEEGTVRVHVLREGSEVVIRVTDDGRGLDRDAIRNKAISRGLLAPDVQVSDRDLYAYILEAGFSTAETVSKIAGRGVGMDVVHSEIRQLGGTLQIDSERGRGTTFTIRLPFTLAVTQAVFVKQGETSFAVPIASVQGVARIDREELETKLAAGDAKFVYAGEEFLIHDMGLLLGDAPVKAEGSLQVPLLLARSGDQRAAICVDQVIGSREIVVKPVGPQVGSIPGIFGATIMGDGRVIVILDVAPLVRRHIATRKIDEPRVVAAPVETRRIPLVMVVDDSITMRKVTSRVLERHSYEVLTAKDGVDAIEKLADRVPDVMLLDIEMPRMDGYELATHMRNDIRLRGVPIIMITSRTGEKHRQRAFEIGVDRYLGKPYQEAELMRNVQEILKVGRGEPA